MAQVVLSPLLEVVIGNLATQFLDEIRLFKGVNGEIEKLSKTLMVIQASLSDAERRQVSEESVKIWLRELKGIAYDADDLIDEFATKLLNEMEDGSSLKNQVCSLSSSCFCFKQIMFRHEVGSRIKEIRERIDEIEKMRRFELSRGVAEEKNPTAKREQTLSVLTEPKVYGREEDRSKIVKMLLVDEEEDISVIPIVGMGGLGKTTLAQLAYNDDRVRKHFEIKIWVYVSDDFNLQRLIKAIIESKTKEACGLSDMDPLQSCLQDELKGRRFLLVLDDVWKEDHRVMHDKWNKMKTILACGARGSKTVVTTRFQEVAKMMGGNKRYDLKGLSEDDCWLLFEQWALGGGRGEAHPNLVSIGREIVRKCGGVALAVKSLASLLYFERDESRWLSIKDSEICNLPEDETGILALLRLSYNHLPLHLKQCFVYCSIFPKDCRIVKESLIQQWIALGFIQSSKGSREVEDIGNEYFNDLLWRSFFQDVEEDDLGNIVRCKMHDLIHDLAKSVAGDEFTTLDESLGKDSSKQTRYVSWLGESYMARVPNALYECKNLRALLFSPSLWLSKRFISQMISSFMMLRILRVGWNLMEVLPISIGKLIHLRYLDLSLTSIKELPETIACLKNLQTLKLGSTIKKLPHGTTKLISLRHLDIRTCDALTHMPEKVAQLSSLQTLSKFIVGKESRCGLAELHSLDLRGSLAMEKLENVSNFASSVEAKLKEKRNLQALKLKWLKDDSDTYDMCEVYGDNVENVEEVLEGLQPHSNLKKLWVTNYLGIRFSRWLMDSSLPNLVQVNLYNCQRCELLPPFGQLGFLRTLILDNMHGLKYLGDEFYGNGTIKGFPSLKTLIVRNMPNLEGWSQADSIDSFPCLEELIIFGCDKLTSLPKFPSIGRLELCSSNSMILRSVGKLTSLSFLGIQGFVELEFLPEGMLLNHTLLQALQISDCKRLRSLSGQLENLTSLKKLAVTFCNELEFSPEGLQNLISLKFFTIDVCNSLVPIPDEGMQHLTSLSELWIQRCRKLTSLPQGIQYLTSLKKLVLRLLPELVSLPEGLRHLSALESLSIGAYSDRFTLLPEWLGDLTELRILEIQDLEGLTSLPAGLQRLSALQRLEIHGCPRLVSRCKKGTGEDWHIIQQVPNINITEYTCYSFRDLMHRGQNFTNFYSMSSDDD